jgi:hypothetical protein
MLKNSSTFHYISLTFTKLCNKSLNIYSNIKQDQPHLEQGDHQIAVFKWILTKRFWENVSCYEVMIVQTSLESCVHHDGPSDSVPEVEYHDQEAN